MTKFRAFIGRFRNSMLTLTFLWNLAPVPMWVMCATDYKPW